MKTVQHFLYLDLIRGIAALSVLIYHLEESIQDRHFFSGSFLAVDLFFLMSGFVLTRAYEARLRSGAMSFKRFVGVRLLRLYPLYFTAIAIGIGYYVFKIAFVPVEPGLMSDLAKAVPAALLVLPSPAATHAFQGAYPFAASAWSLSLELWFNLIYGVLIFRLSTRSIGVIAALAGCLTIFFALREGSFDMGWGWSTMYGGIARFWFSFSLGILIYRQAKMPPYASVLAAILAPIGLAYVTIGHANLWLQGIYIFGIFPLVVMTYA
ncbi:MAG TPA: acyltransferase, partial [Dongiaceae bacterium]